MAQSGFIPPYVAEARRRYDEYNEALAQSAERLQRLLDMPPEELRVALAEIGEERRVLLRMCAVISASMRPLTLDDFIASELNRRSGR